MVTTFMFPIAIAASWKVEHQVRRYMAMALFLETVIIGAFLSLDLLLFFFVFFEALLFPMYYIIGVGVEAAHLRRDEVPAVHDVRPVPARGHPVAVRRVREAARCGDVRSHTARAAAASDGRRAMAVPRVLRRLRGEGARLAPAHLASRRPHRGADEGFGRAGGDPAEDGPYGMLRFNLDLFPEASRYFATAIMVLAVVGIIYGAIVAMMQTDIKRLIAYSSVSHMGLIVLGIFAFSAESMDGAVLQMVNHGLSTGMLFLVFGMLYERTHTREIADLGGIVQ